MCVCVKVFIFKNRRKPFFFGCFEVNGFYLFYCMCIIVKKTHLKISGYLLQNPNALDAKVTLDFDHVKNSLIVDDEGELHS